MTRTLERGRIAEPPEEAFLEWAVAGRPLPGQARSGDGFLSTGTRHGALLAVVDGLGHGAEAEAATQAVLCAFREDPGMGIARMLARAHDLAAPTRGAVATVAEIARSGLLRWAGVGNVEGVVFRLRNEAGAGAGGASVGAGRKLDYAPLRGGILGGNLPEIHVGDQVLEPGDHVVLATDGLDPDFPASLRGGVPAEVASALLEAHGRDADDALVLVARYLGGTS